MTDLRVYIRDRDVERIAEVDDFGALEFVSRDNALGAWTFDLAADSQYVALLDPDISNGLAGIVVTLDGTPIFSGPVIQRQETATSVRFSGYCDNWLLARHVAVPFGGLDDVGTAGVASTAMRQFVNAQIANVSNFPHRQITELTFPGDPTVGDSIAVTVPRYTSMLTALQDMAIRGGGLRFWVQQSTTWSPAYIEFMVEQRRDLRDSVLFSVAAGTLENFSHTRQAASVNHVYAASGAGGDGSTVSPVVEEVDGASILKFGRIESFITQPQTADASEVLTAALAVLAEGGDRRAVTLTPVETSDVQFGRDYGLGDLVRSIARYDGSVQVDAVIREIHVKIEPQRGVSVTPMLGTPGSSNDPVTSQIISRLNDRVRVLERSSGSLGQVRTLDDAIAVLNATTFVGEVKLWPGASAPAANWLICQGQAISRNTYATLFTLIGTAYGPGDGSTTFNVPDLRGRFALGVNGSHALASNGGAETINIQHDHGGATGPPPGSDVNTFPRGSLATFTVPSSDHTNSISDDLSTDQSIMPPYVTLNYIIRIL